MATRTIRREDARLLMGLRHYAAGTTGALGAIMNAVLDALRVRGLSEIDMPVTPARVWRALHGQAQ